jgi:branched-chain amino acid transport system ATP-binding protein
VKSPILSIDSAIAAYGKVQVLKAISLQVNAGEIVTIIGANGAGKTSTLMAISRFLPLIGGSIVFDGTDLSGRSPHELVRIGLCHVPEGRKIFPRLTVQENLELGAFSRDKSDNWRTDLDWTFELFPILGERKSQLAGTLSGGEQQMLAISRALMGKPKLLLLDEPSMGVAPILVTRIFETIQKLNQSGLTVLLVEQNAHLALEIAHRGYVLELGEITLTDTGKALLSNPRVQQAYLGA